MIFIYDDDGIEWGTGLAGINVGNGITSSTIPGSLTLNVLNIDQTSNIGIPGVWVFKVDRSMLENTVFENLNYTNCILLYQNLIHWKKVHNIFPINYLLSHN